MDHSTQETNPMYRFKWSKKDDAAHTISLPGADAYLDAWIRDMRAGCPWRFVAPDGQILRQGVGPQEWLTASKVYV